MKEKTSAIARLLWQLRGIGRLGLVRHLAIKWFRWVYRPGRTVVIKRGPLRSCLWTCRANQQFWMPMGVYENETTDWLAARIKPGTVFVDVGANAGYFTLLGAKIAGPAGFVYSFEPDPGYSDSVRQLLRLNSFANAVVEQKAVGDREAARVSFVMEKQGANSHLGEVELSHAVSDQLGKLEVPLTSLDEYFRGNERKPQVLKIDVEGAEVLVLAGMAELLAKSKPCLILSTHSGELKTECSRMLENAGYHVAALPGFEHELVAEPIHD